ncbi:hypothetical protein ACQP3L_34895, partial [Escherichia coli]
VYLAAKVSFSQYTLIEWYPAPAARSFFRFGWDRETLPRKPPHLKKTKVILSQKSQVYVAQVAAGLSSCKSVFFTVHTD